jgi:hypothetical protein
MTPYEVLYVAANKDNLVIDLRSWHFCNDYPTAWKVSAGKPIQLSNAIQKRSVSLLRAYVILMRLMSALLKSHSGATHVSLCRAFMNKKSIFLTRTYRLLILLVPYCPGWRVLVRT